MVLKCFDSTIESLKQDYLGIIEGMKSNVIIQLNMMKIAT